MKKVTLIVLTLISISCNKEEDTPTPVVETVEVLNCNCANSTINSAVTNMNGYIDLLSECTGNSTRIFAEEMMATSIYYNPDTDITRYCLNRNW